MLAGLKEGQEKMSKSEPDSAIFMEDTADDVKRKIKKVCSLLLRCAVLCFGVCCECGDNGNDGVIIRVVGWSSVSPCIKPLLYICVVYNDMMQLTTMIAASVILYLE